MGLYPYIKMSRLGCLLLIWAICEGVFAKEEKQNGFVEPLDFAPIFDSGDAGLSSLASSPIAAAMLKLDKSQYPQLFDTVVSSSIDSIQRRVAPKENAFSAEHFGFNPIASQGFQSARLVAPPPPLPKRHHQQQQTQPLTHLPIREQLVPLRYDIRTVHDADYKVYKPEENEQEEILAALKQNPSVASYFQPAVTNLEVAHPIKYRKEESVDNPEVEQNYKPNAYVTGSSRIRRYAGGRRSEKLRRGQDEDEDPYNYKAEYISRPKEFDSSLYSSAYKEEKDPNKDYEYPYGYDSGYDHKEYDRIKDLSEKQAAEIRRNPGNCKEVKRDGMSCNVCKDPKTGGNYESCSYVTEPKNNQYAYSKERKFDSNDEPDEPEKDEKSAEQPKKLAKYETPKDDSHEYSPAEPEKTHSDYKKDDDSGDKYKAYYIHSSKPKTSEAIRDSSSESDGSEEKSDSLTKPYNYKEAIPGFYTDTEPKKDVEHVLAEFKKKDRSACKKVQKNGMTCFQCVDKNGLKNEECMFVSESAPQRSHLAYQEVKEFTSKPPTIDAGNAGAVGAESQAVTTTAPAAQKSAAYVVANTGYGKKLKRKKARPANLAVAATNPISTVVPAHKVKRSVESEAEERAEIVDEANVAPPEEFAGDNSRGAYWAETMPRYSAALGVTLPEFMLARSEHEASFDEVVAGA
ncbi:uncharacterized protein LOC126367420 [Pectinophora gossypiella]|uniref:uncharacterized protein LOC126367420 n=1 Tax=Pectinophora gossypiella TaxID=13191 RepID=UPI00214E1DF3|nr:uncharacterized protein LOC126367420 [Pectinophora gossypiella]